MESKRGESTTETPPRERSAEVDQVRSLQKRSSRLLSLNPFRNLQTQIRNGINIILEYLIGKLKMFTVSVQSWNTGTL